jgi:hypothetical protein
MAAGVSRRHAPTKIGGYPPLPETDMMSVLEIGNLV